MGYILIGLLLGSVALAETLPTNLSWTTTLGSLPPVASEKARPGGSIDVGLSTYPLTFRIVGPDSNTVLYTALGENQWSLTTVHPNTQQIVPLLATHWAAGADKKTMYYKIDPKARWSDGKPVTADDFLYTMTFMRSKHIMAPWYNTYYSEQIAEVIKFDDHTIAVRLPNPKPDLHLHADIAPTPKHFYGTLDKDFIKKFNWKVAPVTGPYNISDFRRGKSVTFQKVKNWWAQDRAFFKHRYNVDKITYNVIRELSKEWEYFKKGKIDFFDMSDPQYWYDKSKISEFEKGYIEKLTFYDQRPRMCFGIWLNTKDPLLADPGVRKALAYAMDFEAVNAKVFRGEKRRLKSCWDSYGEYENTKVASLPHSLDGALEALKSSGWTKRNAQGYFEKDGKPLAVNLLYGADQHTERLAVLTEEAKKAGIKLSLDLKDWSAVVKQTTAGKHQAVYSGFAARILGIPTFWGLWHSQARDGGNNNSGLSDPVIDKLIERYRASTERAERVELSKQIQEKVHAHYVLIPGLITDYTRIGYWRWVQFPEPPGTKLAVGTSLYSPTYGGLLWVDQAKRKETLAAKKSGKGFPPVERVVETFKGSS